MEIRKLAFVVALSVLFSCFLNTEMKARDGQNKKPTEAPKMDIGFCIDTTGSMQAEIDIVKAKVKELVAKLASGKPTPDVRVAMVAFRDRGDDYVTKVYPFTDDIDKFVKDITSLRAKGGGDSPEALNQALHVSINDLAWDKSSKTAKMLFLIGDAGPKHYKQDYDWRVESRKAISNGIQINTIGCDGLEHFPPDKGTGVFEKIAKLADGKFELLAYKSTVTAGDGSTREMIIAGGKSYELDSSLEKSEWKKGAKELVSKGRAKLVRSPGSYAGKALGSSRAASFAATAGASARVDRKVSNLDSILIDAAKKRAKQSLKIKYED